MIHVPPVLVTCPQSFNEVAIPVIIECGTCDAEIIGQLQSNWTASGNKPLQVFTKYVPNLSRGPPSRQAIRDAVKKSRRALQVGPSQRPKQRFLSSESIAKVLPKAPTSFTSMSHSMKSTGSSSVHCKQHIWWLVAFKEQSLLPRSLLSDAGAANRSHAAALVELQRARPSGHYACFGRLAG